MKILIIILYYCSSNWKKVFYFPGNHEYYNFEYHEANKYLKLLCDECNVEFGTFITHRIKCKNRKDIYLIMTTLWSYIPDVYSDLIENNINDYKLITYNGNKFTAKNSTELYLETRRNLQNMVENLHKHEDVDIMIFTHHASYMQGTSDLSFENKLTNYAIDF